MGWTKNLAAAKVADQVALSPALKKTCIQRTSAATSNGWTTPLMCRMFTAMNPRPLAAAVIAAGLLLSACSAGDQAEFTVPPVSVGDEAIVYSVEMTLGVDEDGNSDGDVAGFSFVSASDPTESFYVQVNAKGSEDLDFETPNSMYGDHPESSAAFLVVPANATYRVQVSFDKRQGWSAVADVAEESDRS